MSPRSEISGFEDNLIMLYIGIAIVAVIATAAILLMKKKNDKGEITESASGQEFVSEAPEQSAAESDMSGQNENIEEDNFSVPVSAEEEKSDNNFNIQNR